MSRILWVAQSIILVALIGLALFGAAGRLDVPAFWAYLALWLGASLVSVAVVDPTLYQERIRPGGRRIRAVYWLLIVPLVLHLVVAGVDVGRYHWSDAVPQALQWLGMLAQTRMRIPAAMGPMLSPARLAWQYRTRSPGA